MKRILGLVLMLLALVPSFVHADSAPRISSTVEMIGQLNDSTTANLQVLFGEELLSADSLSVIIARTTAIRDTLVALKTTQDSLDYRLYLISPADTAWADSSALTGSGAATDSVMMRFGHKAERFFHIFSQKCRLRIWPVGSAAGRAGQFQIPVDANTPFYWSCLSDSINVINIGGSTGSGVNVAVGHKNR